MGVHALGQCRLSSITGTGIMVPIRASRNDFSTCTPVLSAHQVELCSYNCDDVFLKWNLSGKTFCYILLEAWNITEEPGKEYIAIA